MLKVRLLGQFRVLLADDLVEIPSRPAQSLFAYLVLNAGTAERREKLAGLFWPESTEANARSYLRHALWRLRKALEADPQNGQDFFVADDITIAFDPTTDYWLDTAILDQKVDESWSADDLLDAVSVYRGLLLPGFYDEWILLERERLQAVFERKMQLLLGQLADARRWSDIMEWAERWIALGQTPEPAYRALMIAHGAQGDLSGMATVYQRCTSALRLELGVGPSEQTRDLYDRLSSGEIPFPVLVSVLERLDEAPAPGEPPYKGLQYFGQADAELFFGRELLTAKLVARLAPAKGDRFLAVVGASGCGKSSLVRAGLISALQRSTAPAENGRRPAGDSLPLADGPEWLVHVITPTTHPLEALAASLTRDAESVTAATTLADSLASDPRSLYFYVRRQAPRTSSLLLLVVDQFEELFTLCQSSSERQAFVDNLLTAVELGGPFMLVIALRADFYAHCAQFAALRHALESRQVYIGPMSDDELRRAITGPAEQGGWAIEPGLVELLLQEVGDEPGALPLLSHALLETWRRRRGRTLTLLGYSESGGVRGAVAQTAEQVLQALDSEQQTIARNIFLRLTRLGDGTLDTRRRAQRDELVSRPEDAPAVEAVLRILADARLVTTSEDTVEVAHEILIREWPTLRGWLDENRADLRLHRHLTETAQAWARRGHDPGELYRGARLAQASERAEARASALNPLEREFLEASKELAQRRESEREAARQRELEAARRLAEAEKQRAEEQVRSSRRLRWLALGLAALLLLASLSALFALQQTKRAEHETRQATGRELAAAAVGNLGVDPERSALLALQAVTETYSVDGTVLPEAEDALHQAVQALRVKFTLFSTGGVAFSPDGTRLATTDLDGTAKIRDATSGQELLTLSGHTDEVMNLAFSPDGTRLATTSHDGTAKIWDTVSGEELLTLAGHTAPLVSPAFSPDGARLVTTSFDGTAKIWDTVSGEELLTLPHDTFTAGPDFSPDGSLVAIADVDAAVAKVWDASTGEPFLTLEGHVDGVNEVAFSPDGTRLVTAGSDSTAKMWDLEASAAAGSGEELFTLYGHSGFVYAVDFSPDGTRVASASTDGTAKVWDGATGRELLTLVGHGAPIPNVAFSSDGKRLITGGADGTAKVWDITPEGSREWLTLGGHTDLVFGIDYDPEGKRLASSSWDGTAKVWDTGSGQELLTLAGHADRLASIAFSPEGTRLATASYDGTAKVWDSRSGEELLTLEGHTNRIFGIAYSPDGTRLATASQDGTAKVWDVSAAGEELFTLADPNGSALWRIAFSPDGTRLATATEEGIARIWDVSATSSGRLLHTLAGHTDRVVGLAFSPDGARLATASFDATVRVWDLDVSDGKELATLSGHNAAVWDVAFSPDGTLLATSSFDGVARLWDVSTVLDVAMEGTGSTVSGQELLTLHHNNAGPDLAFSPDGKHLATTNTGAVHIYVLPIEELVALARSRLTRTWTAEECQRYLHLDQCPSVP
jgi:WD40 repeat protein/DNA-binding SARP family transcriptional activator